MPRYEPITKSGFAAQGWRRYDSYAFAVTDAVAPLVVQELAVPSRMITLTLADRHFSWHVWF